MRCLPNLAFVLPEVLYKQAISEMRAISQVELFNESRHKKSQEKWCAAMFAYGYFKFLHPCEVAINETMERRDADFFLKTNGRVYAFQLVEAMNPSRRRGDEYKGFADGTIKSIPYEPERGHLEGPWWIAEKIKLKAEKNYAGMAELNLLVYANFSARDLRRAAVVDATSEFHGKFASIWVLSNLYVTTICIANDLGNLESWGSVSALEELPD